MSIGRVSKSIAKKIEKFILNRAAMSAGAALKLLEKELTGAEYRVLLKYCIAELWAEKVGEAMGGAQKKTGRAAEATDYIS